MTFKKEKYNRRWMQRIDGELSTTRSSSQMKRGGGGGDGGGKSGDDEASIAGPAGGGDGAAEGLTRCLPPQFSERPYSVRYYSVQLKHLPLRRWFFAGVMLIRAVRHEM